MRICSISVTVFWLAVEKLNIVSRKIFLQHLLASWISWSKWRHINYWEKGCKTMRKTHFLEKSSLIRNSSTAQNATITFVWYPEQRKKKKILEKVAKFYSRNKHLSTKNREYSLCDKLVKSHHWLETHDCKNMRRTNMHSTKLKKSYK